MKVLLLALGGIGDFIETVPVIRALRESAPNYFLGLVVAERAWPYASRCPYVNRVYSCPVPGSGRRSAGWTMSQVQIAALLFRLRFQGFDEAINFMEIGSQVGSQRMERFIRFIHPSISFGRNRNGLGKFFDRQVMEADGDGKSDADYFYAVASLLGRPLPLLQPPDLWVLDGEREQAENLLRTLPGEGPLILIHPGSDRKTRCWFPQRFAAVASELCRRRRARVAVISARDDWPTALEIEKLAHPHAVRALPGLSSVGVLAAMIEKADLVVCNNSIAMHVAAAARTPCVAVCASGDIARDRPHWNRDRMRLLWKPLECSPCYHWRCPRQAYMECMEGISVEEVLEATEHLLCQGVAP